MRRIISNKRFHNTRAAGFTFVETLVAVSVLLLAVAAPLTLGSQSLAASRIARDQITATLLAQEAVEYVRWVRDTNSIEADPWLEGIDECDGATCWVDVPANDVGTCDIDGCPALTFDEDTGFYGVDSTATESRFTRGFTVEVSALNPSEAQVRATVSWADGVVDRSVTVEDYIYDWQ